MKKPARRSHVQLKRKKQSRGSYSGAAWESVPEAREEDVNELGSWPTRRGTAEDERRRIASTFREMGIGTD